MQLDAHAVIEEKKFPWLSQWDGEALRIALLQRDDEASSEHITVYGQGLAGVK